MTIVSGIVPAFRWRYDKAVGLARDYKNQAIKRTWEPCARLLVESVVGNPLQEFLATRDGMAIAPEYSDLWSLYRILRELKPSYVVEYGSGVSTVVMAEALRRNGRGLLQSIDADRRWAAETSRTLPMALHDWCEVLYSELEVCELYGRRVFRHRVKPDRVPDMVYLDGPELRDGIEVAADMVDLEPELKPGFVLVIDCRYENTAFLRKHLKRQYQFTRHPAFHQPKFTLVD